MPEGTGEIPKQPIKQNLSKEPPSARSSSKPTLFQKLRNFVTAGTLTAVGVTAAETVANPIDNIQNTASTAAANLSDLGQEALKDVRDTEGGYRDIYGKYLDVDQNGKLFITDEPKIITVRYVPQTDPNSPSQTDIVIRRKPEVVLGTEDRISPKDIQSSYAVRVAGGSFAESGIGRFQVDYKGREYTAGEWIMPTNYEGKPIHPDGSLVQDGEDPYFIAASFVEIGNPPPGTPTSPSGW